MNSNTHSIDKVALVLIALPSFLLAISMLLIGADNAIKVNLGFFQLDSMIGADLANTLAAVAFLIASALSVLAIYQPKYKTLLAYLLIALSSFVLLSLLSSKRWIDDLGGFPAIGSGQGVIKYFALLALGLYFIGKDKWSASTHKVIQLFPVVLVLLWIGGMKFTLLEAKGIEPLVASSPLMAWMYSVWDLQMTSNLIGVYDIIALSLLIASMKFRALLLPALAMSGAVFIVTQTFLFTWDAALSNDTVLTGGGHFLIKDIWYIANLAVFYYLMQQGSDNAAAATTN